MRWVLPRARVTGGGGGGEGGNDLSRHRLMHHRK